MGKVLCVEYLLNMGKICFAFVPTFLPCSIGLAPIEIYLGKPQRMPYLRL